MNELQLFPGSGALPAHVQRRLGVAPAAPLMLNDGGSNVPRISLKGNRFHKVKDGDVETLGAGFMEVSIVGFVPTVSRMWWRAAYDASAEPSLPDCWSTDGRVPDAGVQAPQSQSCAMCALNAKGSGAGSSKACSYKKRLMVIDANEPDTVYQLDVSAMSIFGDDDARNNKFALASYAKHLAKVGCTNPMVLVTRIEFDTRASVPKLLFQPVDYWSEDEDAKIASTVEANRDLIDEQTRSIISVSATQQAAQPAPQGRTRMAAQGSGPAQHSGMAAAQPSPAHQAQPTPAAPPQQPAPVAPPSGRTTRMQAAAPAPAAAPPMQGEIVHQTPFDQQAAPAQSTQRGRGRMTQAAPAQPAQTMQQVAAPTQTVGSVGDLEGLLASIGD